MRNRQLSFPGAVCAGAVLLCAAVSVPRTMAAAANPVPVTQTKDKVAGRTGVFRGGSSFTASGAGHTGKTGDYAVNFPVSGSGPVYVADASFFNTGAAKDELTVAFWAKKYDTVAGSAFWANSPSSASGQRGYQAHVPWDNNNIYFDSAGCCGPETRINDTIENFPNYTGDNGFWTNNWHLFAFSKKGDDKQIWIDGVLFLDGTGAAPLPQDFTDLYIGSDGAGNGLFHAMVDDFMVFSTQLGESDLTALYSGTAPTALPASAGLLAYWDFNDYPAEGQFVSVSPQPGASAGSANTITIVHVDGTTAWDQNNVSLKVDGTAVSSTVQKSGNKATLTYTAATPWEIQSTHTASLTYPAGSQQQTIEWSFTVGPYTKDSVAGRIGTITGGASYTLDAAGHSGKPGDYAIDFGAAGSGPIQVTDGSFLNTAAANDEISFAFWAKKYDIAPGSAFWAVSPSTVQSERGAQAHVPWSDSTIYFDTSGCCGAETRLSDNIADFPDYTGDVSWWTNWHFFVFSKKADDKQIWIDGKLFLEGSGAAPLPTDFTRLVIGADDVGGNLFHAVIDDFSVFSKQLGETDINSLYSGTKPGSLPAADGLLASFGFDDLPPQGIFLSYAPTPDTTNAAPNQISVVHFQGTVPWDLSKVGLSIDGTAVTPATTRNAGKVTVSYSSATLFSPGSTHTAVLTYPGPSGNQQKSWQFTVANYTLDTTHKYVATLGGSAKFTADAGGHSGAAGDYAMDFGRTQAGQYLHVVDASFINSASSNDVLAVAGWQKLYSLANSAFFWGQSPTTPNGQRGFAASPWSDGHIYFDTAGCCDPALQRTDGNIADFPGYSGDASWWTNWHHFVFQKYGSTKEMWIDGQLFTAGDNSNPLPSDFADAYFGADVPDNARLQGVLDDVAIFGAQLDESAITQLASGTLPSALPAADKLLAYWNFNDPTNGASGSSPTVAVTRSGGKITLTFTGALQSADAIDGTWSDVQNAVSPFDVNTTEAHRFYRAKR